MQYNSLNAAIIYIYHVLFIYSLYRKKNNFVSFLVRVILWPNVRAWSPDSLVAGGARARARFAIDRRDLLDLLLVSSRLAQSRPVAAPARTLGGIPARRDAATPAVRVISEDRPSNVCANDSTAC